MIIYFTPTSPPLFEPYLDPCNYHYVGEEVTVPPGSLVICIPCQNMEPSHCHSLPDCMLLTYYRGWDHVLEDDFITVFVLDNENPHTPLHLESGELLATFLIYNQESFGASYEKCVMGVNPYWPLAPDAPEIISVDSEDDGYDSSNMSV